MDKKTKQELEQMLVEVQKIDNNQIYSLNYDDDLKKMKSQIEKIRLEIMYRNDDEKRIISAKMQQRDPLKNKNKNK
ncbi:hypothetical protein EBU24_06415 [bacterium]|nr:hypothetical protein [bacterium]